MTKTFDQLIDLANNNLDSAEQAEFEDSTVYSNLAKGYAMIAIAQELHRMNERGDIEAGRQELVRELMSDVSTERL